MAKAPRKFEGTSLESMAMEVAEQIEMHISEGSMDAQMEQLDDVKTATLNEAGITLPSIQHAVPTTFIVDGGMIEDDTAKPVDPFAGAKLSGRYRVKEVRQVGAEDTLERKVRNADAQSAFAFDWENAPDPNVDGILSDLNEMDDVDRDAMSGISFQVVLEPIMEDLGAAKKPDQVLRRVKRKGSDAT
jgi:hypothetical protein